MKLFHILLFILAITLSTFGLRRSLPPGKAAIEGRITHGQNATEGQFPYQVGLLLDGINPNIDWCGGCLIGAQWVLTAAHCLTGVRSVTVFLGATVRLMPEDKRYATKQNFIIHHGYNNQTFRDDIALIRIPPVTFSNKIRTIKLPSIFKPSQPTYTNGYAIGSGWGKTSDKNQFVTMHLQWSRFRIISNDECRMTYRFVPESSICVATPGAMSPCYGDSGGPLVSETDGALIGAFSFLNTDGCELDHPVAYVRLTNYLDWIYYWTGIYN